MAIPDLMEGLFIEKGFERVVDLEAVEDSAKILYGDIRQYRRTIFPFREMLVADKVGLSLIEGPVYEKMTVFYPKPQSSAKEIMVHYQFVQASQPVNRYGYFGLDGEPLDKNPYDKEEKSHALEILRAVNVIPPKFGKSK